MLSYKFCPGGALRLLLTILFHQGFFSVHPKSVHEPAVSAHQACLYPGGPGAPRYGQIFYDTAQWEDTSFTSISDWTRTAGRSPPFAQMQNIDLSGLNHMGGTYFPWVIPEII